MLRLQQIDPTMTGVLSVPNIADATLRSPLARQQSGNDRLLRGIIDRTKVQLLASDLATDPEAYFGDGDVVGEEPMRVVAGSSSGALIVMM